MSSPASDDAEADFSCNICLCTCVEPVVTLCGHLFCWRCLYRWMDGGQPGSNECPCCKAGISRSTVIPMYGRGASGVNRRKNAGAPPSEAAAAPAASSASAVSDSRPEGAPLESESPAAPAASAASASFASSSADSTSSAAASGAASAAASSSGPIPDRPAAQRPPAAPRPAPARGGAGFGNPFGFGAHPFGPLGGIHMGGAGGGGVTFFGMGFGLVPSLLTFAFAALQQQNPQEEEQQEGQPPRPQSSPFGTLMLWLGILVIVMLIYA